MRVQRLRTTFARGAQLRYITHLDMMRFWERALRRAAVPLAYSEGFSPHPQISLAVPLPVGITAAAELMDVYLAERLSPVELLRSLSPQLPPGLSISEVQEVPLGLPSMQSQMRAAEYCVRLSDETDVVALRQRIEYVLGLQTLPWQHLRENDVRNYDLRVLIQDLGLGEGGFPCTLLMRLQADNSGTGRPDQVLASLELPAGLEIERTRLILATPELAAP